MNFLKSIHYYLAIVLIISGCNPDPVDLKIPEAPVGPMAKIHLNVQAVHGGSVLEQSAFNVPNGLNQKEKFTNFKFYLSEIAAVNSDGLEIELSEVELVNIFGGSTFFSFELPVGAYTQFKVRVGLEDEINATDPATVGSSHPLSANQGMWWSWNDGYKFAEVEGWLDIDAATPDQNDISIAYHCGTSGLSFGKEKIHSWELTEDEIESFSLLIETSELIADGVSPINPTEAGQNLTHSSGVDGIELAQKFMDNFSAATEFE